MPAVHILLTNKTEQLYFAVLSALRAFLISSQCLQIVTSKEHRITHLSQVSPTLHLLVVGSIILRRFMVE